MELEDKVKLYYKSISQFNEEEGFVSILPGMETSDYLHVMRGLIEETEKEIKEFTDMMNDGISSIEDETFIINSLKSLRERKDLLENKLVCDLKEEEELNKDICEGNINDSEKIIIFATNKYGNCPAFDDLIEIFETADETTKNSFINMINQLREDICYNEEKARALNNNEKLKGVFEKKEYKSRIFFEYAAGCIVVIGASVKKSDNDKRDHNFIINRKQGADDFIKDLKSNKNNKEYIMSLTDKTSEMLSSLNNGRSL